MPEIEYRIESADTDRREFHIAIHFTPRKENYPITLRMPAWTPGSYLLREYAGSISDIEAYQGETPLNVIKSDKATFVLANTSGDRTPVTIRYALTAVDPSVRKTWISTDRAFISGAAAFLQISGEENTPCRIAVSPAPWDKVSTALPQIIHDGEPFLFSAKDYDHLIDCPILLSRDSDTLSTEFSVHGAVHRLVIAGCPEADAARLTEDLKKICATTIELWEPETKKPPFSDYLFLLTVSGRWGGLEHRNSVAAEAPFSALPMTGAEAPDRYTDLLALMAHEYFHAWNVKRLKPATFLMTSRRKTTHGFSGSLRGSRSTTRKSFSSGRDSRLKRKSLTVFPPWRSRFTVSPAGSISPWQHQALTPGSSTTARTPDRPPTV